MKVSNRWWEQEGINLAGEREVTYISEEMEEAYGAAGDIRISDVGG